MKLRAESILHVKPYSCTQANGHILAQHIEDAKACYIFFYMFGVRHKEFVNSK